jgi:hypothetical protein
MRGASRISFESIRKSNRDKIGTGLLDLNNFYIKKYLNTFSI